MDNYIVQIYRRKQNNSRVPVGLVEKVGTQEKKAFNDLDDLWEILNSKERDMSLSSDVISGAYKDEK